LLLVGPRRPTDRQFRWHKPRHCRKARSPTLRLHSPKYHHDRLRVRHSTASISVACTLGSRLIRLAGTRQVLINWKVNFIIASPHRLSSYPITCEVHVLGHSNNVSRYLRPTQQEIGDCIPRVGIRRVTCDQPLPDPPSICPLRQSHHCQAASNHLPRAACKSGSLSKSGDHHSIQVGYLVSVFTWK
jgi:hypothetical protein